MLHAGKTDLQVPHYIIYQCST